MGFIDWSAWVMITFGGTSTRTSSRASPADPAATPTWATTPGSDVEADFFDMLTSTALVAPWQSFQGAGFAVPAYGADVSYACRISLKDELVRSRDGREIAARGKVYLRPATGLLFAASAVPSTKDRITLPAGYVPANPPILDVQPEQDESGVHHVVLVIG